MPPKSLNTSLLAALGLSAIGACRTNDTAGETDTGPCLDFATEAGTEPVDTGPCLDFDTDTWAEGTEVHPDNALGPCLDVAGTDDSDTDTAGARRFAPASAAQARKRVLDRGVLPGDVATILKNRSKS